MTYPADLPFEGDVRMLAERAGSIPMGWRAVYYGCLSKLMSVSCPARHGYRLAGPFDAEGTLHIVYAGDDKVVCGIVDRLERTAACTCEVCGRSAKRRTMINTTMVLCGRCAAPRLLRDAIGVVLNQLALAESTGTSLTIPFDDVPFQLRMVLQPTLWPPATRPESDPAHPDVTHKDLHRARPMLIKISSALERAIDAQITE
tara:strand:+ start:280 stop:885 length:606 start_codon:yes stop_codon:yes gene_type:complete